MININKERTEVDIGGGQVLKLKQNIDYKPTAQEKITIGRVDKFTLAPETDSVWMLITEIEDARHKDWQSVENWKNQYLSGLFENKSNEPKNLIDVSTQPTDDDLPF